MTTTLKCADCGATYPSRYYFADVANGTVCTGCAVLAPEERARRRDCSRPDVGGERSAASFRLVVASKEQGPSQAMLARRGDAPSG